jgi:hypothetical protein
MSRRRRPRALPRALAVAAPVVAAVVLVVAGLSDRAGAQAPFPPRQGLVANGTEITVSQARLQAEFNERIGGPYSLEGLVLLVNDCRPDPESYLDQALVAYGLAPRAGEMNDNAVAWMVCLEPRFTSFYFAANNRYAGRLDETAATDVMVQPLRDGNFTGAFTASFDVVAGQLGGAAAPAAASVGGNGSRGSGRGLLAVAGLAVMAGGGFLWWRRRGAPSTARQQPGTAAMADMDRRMAALRLKLTPDSQAVARIVLAYESMGDEAILEVHRRHQTMVERLSALEQRMEQLRSQIAASDGSKEEMEALTRDPRAELEQLEAYVAQVEGEADHAEMLDERAPVMLVEARQAIATAVAEYGRDSAGLDLPEAEGMLAVASWLADQGESMLTEGKRVAAGHLGEGAKHVAQAVAPLPEALRSAAKAVDDLAAVFPRMEAYAPASWADVKGNGSEAEESLDAAKEMLRRMAQAGHESYGQDVAAGFLVSVRKVNDEFDRANRLVEAVGQRLAFLDKAREDAAATRQEVEQDLANAREWLARPDVDADVSATPTEQLDKVEHQLGEAALAMESPRPDWIAILRSVGQADKALDDALAGARAEQERIAAARRQLETSRTDASAAVDRAERYLAAHGADVASDAPTRVGDARSALNGAASAATEADTEVDAARLAALSAAGQAFQQARQLADTAYEAMAASVARAEETRPAYQPRPEWMGPVVPIPRGPGPIIFGGLPGGRPPRPERRSRWGTRPVAEGGRSSSTRRGGGRGW